MLRFELKTHPYCDSCSEFDVYVEEMDYETFFGKDTYSRTITCRHYQRCEAIEKHLRRENTNEDNTSSQIPVVFDDILEV